MPPSLRALVFAVAALVASVAVAGAPPAPPAPLTVVAAASLKEGLDAAAAAWTTRSGQRVVVSYAASSALARQIEQGAPADVFVSADLEWMDYLATRKRIDASSRANLVGNRLVVIAPATSTLQRVRTDDVADWLGALGSDGRLAVADVDTVPAGRYAKQSLQTLHVWPHLARRLAPSENVRAALAFVARGEAPLGIVYASDAQAEPKVRVVAELRDDSHAPIVYPIARLRREGAVDGSAFIAFLRSAPAQAMFARAGFRRAEVDDDLRAMRPARR